MFVIRNRLKYVSLIRACIFAICSMEGASIHAFPSPSFQDQVSPQKKEQPDPIQAKRAELQKDVMRHWINGKLDLAIKATEQLIEIEAKIFGSDDARLSQRYDSLAAHYLELGESEKASRHIENACRVLLADHPVDSWQGVECERKRAFLRKWADLAPDVKQAYFDTQREMSQNYDSKRWEDALQAAERFAQWVGEQFGESDPAWVEAISTIQWIHLTTKNLEAMGPQLENLHGILMRVEHPDHPNLGKLLRLLAVHANARGDIAASLKYGKGAVEQFERGASTYDQNYSKSLGEYASNLLNQGDRAQAIPLLRKAYAIWSQDLAMEDSRDTGLASELCFSLADEADKELRLHHWVQAEELLRESQVIALKTWGNEHYRLKDIESQLQLTREAQKWSEPQIADLDSILSARDRLIQLRSNGNPIEILDVAQQRWQAAQKLFGNDSLTTLTIEGEWYELQMRHGRFTKDGRESLSKSLREFIPQHEVAVGIHNPSHAQLCFNAADFFSVDQKSLAIDFARRSAESYRATDNPGSSDYLVARALLGSLLAEEEDSECIEILTDAIQRFESSPWAGSYRHCIAALRLGRFYYETDEQNEARVQLSKAIPFIKKNNVVPYHELANGLNYLGNTHFDEGDNLEALHYYREALGIYRQAPNGRPNDFLLYNAGSCCYHTQQYVEAEELLTELVKRFPENSLSSTDAFRSGCYYLAKVLSKRNKVEGAQRTLQRATAAVQMHYGEDPLIVAEMLLENAEFQIEQGRRDDADRFLEQSFDQLQKYAALQEKKGKVPEIRYGIFFRILDRVVDCSEEIGAWNRSVKVRQFVAPLVKANFAKSWNWIVVLERRQLIEARLIAKATPEQQRKIWSLRARTKYMSECSKNDYGNYEKTEYAPLAEAYDTATQILGEYNLIAADFRQEVANYLEHEQDFQEALLSQQYAFLAYMTLFGDQFPIGPVWVKLGRIARQIGGYKECQTALQTGIKVLSSAQGDESKETAEAMLELAKLFLDVKDYASALPLAKKAEDTCRKFWGTSHVIHADAIQVLGEIYFGLNEHDVAANHLSRSHEILKERLDPMDRRLLHAAARDSLAQGWRSKSSDLPISAIEEVLARYQESKQTHRTDFVQVLIDYGDLLLNHQKNEEAEKVLQSAAGSIVELVGFGDDAKRAGVFSRLGLAQRRLGKLDQGSENLAKAAELQRRLFGGDSQMLGDTLFQQAIVSQLTGNIKESERLVEESLLIEQKLLANIGLLLSDRSLTAILANRENRLSLLLEGLIDSQKDAQVASDPELSTKGFYWTLQRKGLALDLSCRMGSLQQSRLYDSKAVRLASRIRLLNQEMSDLALSTQEKSSLNDIRAKQAGMAREIATLNSELSLTLRGNVVQEVEADEVNVVRKMLPQGTLFIEYVRLDRFATDAKQGDRSPHYVAFLLSSDSSSPIQMVDLGNADEIDQLIESLRAETRDFRRDIPVFSESALEARYQQFAVSLYRKLLGPFEASISQSNGLIIGPDSQISLVPFAALVDNQGKYLVEGKDIRYVSSSRELLRKTSDVGKGTLIVASPNFDADAATRQEAFKGMELESDNRQLLVSRGSVDIELRSILRWGRLPGAEGEADEVAALLKSSPFQPVKKHLGNDAAEEILKGAQSPRIVHLATHGFYLPFEDDSKQGMAPQGTSKATNASSGSGLARLRTNSNPLMRSGIVLAGANRLVTGNKSATALEDGWVTAQEIAGMNFRNTELIVLSACESGLGDISDGQGSQGIRRAFTAAGAHSILTSLFVVPDSETRDLMRRFYQKFAVSNHRTSSINFAQREQIAERRQKHGAAHPFYWASFVLLSGIENQERR